MKKLVMGIILIVDIVVDFFVVYFTAMQTRTIYDPHTGRGGTIYRGATYFTIFPGKCIPWYIILGLITIIIICIYVSNLSVAEKKKIFKAEEGRCFCSKCGKQILSDSAFCQYCGAKVVK